jgi:hypothetical protein
MKVREKKRFVIELGNAELNALYEWLEKSSQSVTGVARPKVIDDLQAALYGVTESELPFRR